MTRPPAPQDDNGLNSPAEFALREENAQLRARIAELERELRTTSQIIEKSPVMVSIVRGPEFVYEMVNPAFQTLAPGKQFLGQRFADVWEAVSDPLLETLRRVIATGDPFEIKDAPYRIKRSPGGPYETVYVSYRWIPVAGPDGKFDRILTLAEETTAAVLHRQAGERLATSEKSYQTLFEAIPAAFALCEIVCDDSGRPYDYRHLAVNPAYERHAGLKAADVIGATFLELFPATAPVWIERYGKVVLDGEVAQLEEQLGPLGHWFEVTAFRVEPGRLGVIFSDITTRRQQETERLRLMSEAAERAGELQAVLDAVPVAISIAHDPQCLRITGNASAEEFARAGEAVTYKMVREGVELSPEELPLQLAAATGQPAMNADLTLVFQDGRSVPMLVSAVPLFDGEGKVRGAIAAGADITPLLQAEGALRESEAVLRSFFDSPGVVRGITELVDGRSVHISGNAAAAAMFGVDRESLAGRAAEELGAPGWLVEKWAGLCEESLQAGTTITTEYAHRYPDGRQPWLLFTVGYLGLGPSGNPRFAYTALDRTGQKRAEEALRESEARFRAMADSCPAIIWVTDAEGQIQFVNQAYHDFFSTPGDEGGCELFNHPEATKYAEPILPAVRDRTPLRAEARVRHANGNLRWLESYGQPRFSPAGEYLGHAGLSFDITERKQAEIALRDSREFAQATIDALTSHVVVLDESGTIIAVNRAWTDFGQKNGLARAEESHAPGTSHHGLGVGENYLAVCDEATGPGAKDAATFAAGVRAVLMGASKGYSMDYGCNSPDEERWFTGRVSLFDGYRERRILVEHIDISQSKQIEEALREGEETTRTLLETAAQAILAISSDGTIVLVNRMAEEMFGYARADLLGRAVDSLLPPAMRERHIGHWAGFGANPRERPMGIGLDLHGCRKDGSKFPLEISLSSIETSRGRLAVAFITDITARKRAETALRNSELELRALAGSLLTASEDERRRLAGELHDDVTQRLAFLAIEIGKTAVGAYQSVEEMRGALHFLQQQVNRITGDVRRLSHGLHPSMIEDLGLSTAMEELFVEFGGKHRIDVSFEGLTDDAGVAPGVAACLYRIAQEGLRNVSKHAHASEVNGSLTIRDGEIEFRLSDSGVGFLYDTAKGQTGLGIISMKERVRLVCGTVTIHSLLDQGTEIVVLVPVSGRKNE